MAIKKVKRIRDISLCLVLAKQIRAHAEDGEYSPELNTLLVDKLEALDGRTGTREQGKGAALTPVASVAKKRELDEMAHSVMRRNMPRANVDPVKKARRR